MTHNTTPVVSTRSRHINPSPPAPVPLKRPAAPAASTEDDKSDLRGTNISQGTSDRDVVRATGSMAVATLLSRITGFIRTVLITATLGGAIASAFQTANQLPNLITEIVLGAVLTSLVVPVLVRAEKEDPDRGALFIRRLFTLTVSLLAVITVVSVAAAPALSVLMLKHDGMVNISQATAFAYVLLPQIFFYGLFALSQAVLNTKGIFAPGAWAPVVNNVVSIVVLGAYWLLPGRLDPTAQVSVFNPHVLLLGLGTTAGVVVQCVILFPYLKRAGIDLRPAWGLDARLRQFGHMAIAIVAYVAISQAGFIVNSRVASDSSAIAPVVYQNAWLLLQVPYGVIGVTLLTAIMPRLSRNAADGDEDAVIRDLTLGTKLTFIALIPIVIFFTAFGIPIARGLFQYGLFGPEQAELLGLTLSFSAFTLIPYALVLLHLRVFYAREEAWTPTFIIAAITATKVALVMLAPTVAGSAERVVILLGTANGFGFISGAVIGGILLRGKLGSLGGRAVAQTSAWAAGAALVGVAVSGAGFWAIMRLAGQLPPLATLLTLGVIGIIFIIVTGMVLARSGLPEVHNVGRALQRVPGLSRFIRVDASQAIAVAEPSAAELAPLFASDAFNSSPVPPPMSAGIVRGPSLVPGAPVSDGRFRLLRDYGSVPGARFWQAKEQATGRFVALTFVDTTSKAPLAPTTPAVVARRAATVARNTRALAALELPSVASGVEVLSYRTGCLVVADWIEGSRLTTVAEADDLDPKAVARALVPLSSDTATAHEAGIRLGLDNRARLRVSTSGTVMLAFPAVLEDASVAEDEDSLAKTLALLGEATSPYPKPLREIIAAAPTRPARESAAALADYAPLEDAPASAAPAEEGTLSISEPEVAPTVAEKRGFGGRGFSGSGFIAVGTLAIIFVIAMAALTVWIVRLFGQSPANPVAPVPSTLSAAPQSQTADAGAPQQPAITLPPVMVPVADILNVPDSQPAELPWSPQRSERGLAIFSEQPAHLRHLIVHHNSGAGHAYEVYGLYEPTAVSDAESANPHSANRSVALAETASPYAEASAQPLATGVLDTRRTVIGLADSGRDLVGVILWLPAEAPSAQNSGHTAAQNSAARSGPHSTAVTITATELTAVID